jgi:polysaccharide biosynthesis/export protein
MKLNWKQLSAILAIAACLLFLARPVIAQDASQDQGQDPGADVQATEPNAQMSGDMEVEGGGVIGADYKLGPEDVVTITVFDLPEMTQTARVENDGTINVKLLGRVPAAGLTTTELKKELERAWGKTYLEDPIVSIFIKQFHSTPVSVVGAVAKPGLYQLPGPRTLLEVIAMAGGVNMPGAAGSTMQGGAPAGRWAYITRKDGFADLKPTAGVQKLAPDQVKVDLGRLLYSHDTGLDLEVKPFDTITVSKAGLVYVVGAVQRSGGFTLEDVDSLTALQALSLAQGCSGVCNMHHDAIIHRSPDGKRELTFINLGKIMKGKAKDPILKANDMLVVPSSVAKNIGLSSIGLGTGALSGFLIWHGI